jgi:hypothetical protein
VLVTLLGVDQPKPAITLNKEINMRVRDMEEKYTTAFGRIKNAVIFDEIKQDYVKYQDGKVRRFHDKRGAIDWAKKYFKSKHTIKFIDMEEGRR